MAPDGSDGGGEGVAVLDLADELGLRKQRVFKALRRLGIQTAQRRSAERGGQMVAICSPADAARLRADFVARAGASPADTTAQTTGRAGYLMDDVGTFYVIRLEPDHDPGRFKVGFTTELEGRLRKHRCSAPFAIVARSWPSLRRWEPTAIDCLTAGCEQLHTEVFRASDLAMVLQRGENFFKLMPSPADASDTDEGGADGDDAT